jgi:hypothetical protein
MTDQKKSSGFEKLNLDPYTHAILCRIGPETFAEFTPEQQRKLIDSISACRPLQKHPLDLRGVISIFFVRYYFVILAGRDRRRQTIRIEGSRRRKVSRTVSLVVSAIFLLLMMTLLLVVFFVIAYLIKCQAGINIFPDKHLMDFFR